MDGWKSEGRDLISDLGPRNRFDRLAGEAQLAGIDAHDRGLVDLGKELGRMISAIPYDSDRFHRVIAKANEVEARLDELKLADQTMDLLFEKEDGASWQYALIMNRDGRYRIALDNWRTAPERLKSDTCDKIRGLLDEIRRTGVRRRVDASKLQEFGTEYTDVFDQNGRLVCRDTRLTHEDGKDVGYRHDYFFDSRDDALKYWEEVKRLVADVGCAGRPVAIR